MRANRPGVHISGKQAEASAPWRATYDLHIYYDEFKTKPPVIMGHEVAGVVADIGEGVTNCRPGDRVTSETYFYVCGKCQFCREGHVNLCPQRRSIGSGVKSHSRSIWG